MNNFMFHGKGCELRKNKCCMSKGDRVGLVLTKMNVHGYGLVVGEATVGDCFPITEEYCMCLCIYCITCLVIIYACILFLIVILVCCRGVVQVCS